MFSQKSHIFPESISLVVQDLPEGRGIYQVNDKEQKNTSQKHTGNGKSNPYLGRDIHRLKAPGQNGKDNAQAAEKKSSQDAKAGQEG